MGIFGYVYYFCFRCNEVIKEDAGLFGGKTSKCPFCKKTVWRMSERAKHVLIRDYDID